ncbi:MAG TPA: hypothetical protein VI451_14325, partial [Anaerolineales bacterium]|nr:hypothetical protein [Anaerolineales bacterium]
PYPGGLIESIAFSPDGDLLAAAVNDEIWLRQVSDGEVIARLDGHEGRIFDLTFSPDGQYLASSSNDQTAVLWKVRKDGNGWAFEFLHTLAHNDWVRTLAFSPDSTTLATGAFDSSIVLWNIPDGQYIQILRRTTQDQVIALAFSPDGEQIAAGTLRGLRLWTYGLSDATFPASTTFFSFKKDEQFTTNNPYLAPSPRGVSVEPTVVFSIEEAQPLVSFPIQEPQNLPPGFTISGIYIVSDPVSALEIVSLTYLRTTSFQPAFLTITQSQTNPIRFDFQLGRHAHVGRTFVNGQFAELVYGGWNITSNTTGANGQLTFQRIWDEELASRWLRWQAGDFYFSILYDQPFNQQSIAENQRFPVEQLLEIAESLR